MPNVVSGLTRMLDCLFLPFVPKETEEEPDPETVLAAKQKLPTLIEPLFFMGLIWSAGASCSGKSRLVFDEFLRTKMKEAGSKAGLLATRGLVYDFVFDTDETTWR